MRADRFIALAGAVVVVVGTLLFMGPALARPDIFDGDAAHHVFWLYRYADPELFRGDITAEYLYTSGTLGYRAIYSVLAPVMDAAFATKLVGALLLLVTGWLAWQAGSAPLGPHRALRGLVAVVTFFALLGLDPGIDLFQVMGLQRTFAMALTLLCLWGLASNRYLLVGLSWLLAGIIYPVVLPVLGLAAGVVFLTDMVRERRMPDHWIANAVLAAAGIAIAVLGMPKAPEKFLPWATYVMAKSMPEFGVGGRMDLWGAPGPNSWMWGPIMGLGWPPKYLLGIAVAAVVALVTPARRLLPLGAWALLAVGLFWWLLLRLYPDQTMFGLYVPNRHARWVIAVFAMVAVSAAASGLVQLVTRRAAERGQAAVEGTLAAVLAAASIALLAPAAYAQWHMPPDQDLENVYAFVHKLPKDTLLAAHPDLANYFPVRAQRSMLAATETSMPWLVAYNDEQKRRVTASLRAAYATRWEDVERELRPYGVRYVVSGPQVWRSTHYLQPYDPLVQELWTRGRAAGFVLEHPPAARVVFRSGDYYVLRLAPRDGDLTSR